MKVTVKIVQEINKMYKQGYNMKDVGVKLGLCSSTVCKYVWEPRAHGTVGLIE